MATTALIDGLCDRRFNGVRDAFAANFTEGLDVGASVAVTVDGAFVVDLWGGHMDEARSEPWHQDTIVNVFSSTKTMAALCALVLADRGKLDLDGRVADYWPEFGCNGKEDIRMRHVLGHTSGLSGWACELSETQLYDWDYACTQLAAQAPWWPPGTASGYHALTHGHLIGEVVRRIDGRSPGRFFREEIAAPMQADFHIGLAESEFARVATLIPPDVSPSVQMAPPPGSIAELTMKGTPTEVAWTRGAGWRKAEIPAANGHGNARSMARAQTAMACGGSAFGHRLLSPVGAQRVLEEQSNGIDHLLGIPVRFGMGYGIVNASFPFSPNPNTCFWGGYGGSVVLADQDARVCFTYAMNRMRTDSIVGDIRSKRMLDALYAAL